MLVTTEELSKFSGHYPDDDSLQLKYIKASQEFIATYVGYDPETNTEWQKTRTVNVYVYSDDGVNFYSDEEMENATTIPDGVIPQQTLIENQWVYETTETYIDVPEPFAIACLEISTLLQLEEQNNIGINSKSFDQSGSRTFLNVVDFSKYLMKLARYKKARIY